MTSDRFRPPRRRLGLRWRARMAARLPCTGITALLRRAILSKRSASSISGLVKLVSCDVLMANLSYRVIGMMVGLQRLSGRRTRQSTQCLARGRSTVTHSIPLNKPSRFERFACILQGMKLQSPAFAIFAVGTVDHHGTQTAMQRPKHLQQVEAVHVPQVRAHEPQCIGETSGKPQGIPAAGGQGQPNVLPANRFHQAAVVADLGIDYHQANSPKLPRCDWHPWGFFSERLNGEKRLA